MTPHVAFILCCLCVMIRMWCLQDLLSRPAARYMSALCCEHVIAGLICGKRHAQAGKVMGGSSILAAGSEGTVDTTTLPATSCPECPTLAGTKQEVHQANSKHREEPAGQQGHACEQQRSEEQQDKRQKVEGQPPRAILDRVQGAPQGAVQELAEPPVQICPGQAGQPGGPVGQAQAPAQHQAEEQAEQLIVARLRARVGKLHMNVIRDTMMCQQAIWKEQVGVTYTKSFWPQVLWLCMLASSPCR